MSEMLKINNFEKPKICNPKDCNIYKKLQEAKQIIQDAIKDFNHEIGTPYYEKLITKAKELGINNANI